MKKKSGLADSPFFAEVKGKSPTPPPDTKVDEGSTPRVAQHPTQQFTQPSKPLSKHPSKKPSKQLKEPLSTDAIENAAFQLRKQTKARINADIPLAWKSQLDDLAYELQVGKYELVMYIIGRFLTEIESDGHH